MKSCSVQTKESLNSRVKVYNTPLNENISNISYTVLVNIFVSITCILFVFHLKRISLWHHLTYLTPPHSENIQRLKSMVKIN